MKHELPESARRMIADLAARSPELGHWLSGWFEGKGVPPGQGQIIIDAAHVEVNETEPTA